MQTPCHRAFASLYFALVQSGPDKIIFMQQSLRHLKNTGVKIPDAGIPVYIRLLDN